MKHYMLVHFNHYVEENDQVGEKLRRVTETDVFSLVLLIFIDIFNRKVNNYVG